MSVLTEKTLQTIAQRHIHPISPWASRLENGAYWFGTVLLIVFAAIMSAFALHAVLEIDWDAYAKAHFSWYEAAISGVPFLLILFLLLFLIGSVLLLHLTRRGYRYSILGLFVLFLFSSVALGYSVEVTPLDQPIENFLLSSLPHAERLQAGLLPSAQKQWSQPEKGLLGGSVVTSDTTDIMLRDSSQALWTVDYSGASVDQGVSLDPEEEVKVIGNQDGERAFHATEIRTWEKSPTGKSESGDKTHREKKVKSAEDVPRTSEKSSDDNEERQDSQSGDENYEGEREGAYQR